MRARAGLAWCPKAVRNVGTSVSVGIEPPPPPILAPIGVDPSATGYSHLPLIDLSPALRRIEW
jgi:hypothetical protein